jgi:hypothetical protein
MVDNLWARKDWAVSVGWARVIGSYSAHALKPALRYFNHTRGV